MYNYQHINSTKRAKTNIFSKYSYIYKIRNKSGNPFFFAKKSLKQILSTYTSLDFLLEYIADNSSPSVFYFRIITSLGAGLLVADKNISSSEVGRFSDTVKLMQNYILGNLKKTEFGSVLRIDMVITDENKPTETRTIFNESVGYYPVNSTETVLK